MQTLKNGRSRRTDEWRRFCLRSRGLLALVLLVMVLSVAAVQAPQAQASSVAGSGPIVHWDQSMIYPGHNSGNPEGPVGETTVVHGAGFTANQALNMVIVAGNSLTKPASCQPPTAGTSVLVGTATTDATGNFNATFAWPAGVGQTGQVRINSICTYDATNTTLLSSREDGPFTVLTDSKPAFSLSTTSVAAGGTLTVTGQNWVPPQPINISIASCADCDPGNANIANATTTSVGLSSGTFSVNIPIPATMAANNYVVNVFSQAGPLDAAHIDGLGVKQLAVTAAVATPTPTAAPSPSVTAVSTQAAATPTTVGSSSTNATSGGNGLVIGLLIALALVLLIAGGVIFFLLARRKKSEETSGPSNGAQTPMTPFAQGQAGNLSSMANSRGAFPANNQANRSWSGNPQSAPGLTNVPPGAGMHRSCPRCGSPLAPNASVCGACGANSASDSHPNDPTVAY